MALLTLDILNEFLDIDETSLYIHIPFCKSKCFYCDFYSQAADADVQERVIQEIIKQLLFFKSRFPAVSVKTIYIGGGTPSILPFAALYKLLDCIRSRFGDTCKEFTIEANPESLSSAFIALCNDFSVNRISLGIQTFDDHLLALIGRITRKHDILKALDLLKSNFPGELNLDLISGLPGQTMTGFLYDLETIKSFNPGHISLYALTVEQDTLLNDLIKQKKIENLSYDLQDELWLYGREFLINHGYNQYEISNFALTSKECLHNLRYWELKTYTGAGPGAVSTLVSQNNVIRISNSQSIEDFLSGEKDLWRSSYEQILKKDFLFENLLMGLRTSRGIDKTLFISRFKNDFKHLFPLTYKKWIQSGALIDAPSSFYLSPESRLVLNHLLTELSVELDSIDISLF